MVPPVSGRDAVHEQPVPGYQGRDFVTLAIFRDVQEKEVVAPFVEDYGLAFPVLLDP
jgi:hypothetical protein